MKKHKIFKTLGFASLAVLMGFGATMAFAPLGNVQPTSLATSQPTDVLVTPQEDDLVLFTTEDGLEIKWGNDTSSSCLTGTPNSSVLTSGNLSGFPYFTTTDGTTTYTWVIIGRNADVSDFFTKPNYSYLFSSWKTTHNKSGSTFNTNAYYFFNNTYETTSPAGSAINNTVSSSYVSDLSRTTISVTSNAEIPSGCVLVLANGNVATGAFATISRGGSGSSSNPYRYRPGTLTMSNALEGYYTNGSYGLSAIKSSIQAVSITSKVSDSTVTETRHIFGLASNTSEKFAYSNYLTAAQGKLTANFWLRSNSGAWTGDHGGSRWGYSIYLHYVNTSGAIASSSCSGNPSNGGGGTAPTAGYRPAFILKI